MEIYLIDRPSMPPSALAAFPAGQPIYAAPLSRTQGLSVFTGVDTSPKFTKSAGTGTAGHGQQQQDRSVNVVVEPVQARGRVASGVPPRGRPD